MASLKRDPKTGKFIKQTTERFSNKVKSIPYTLLASIVLIAAVVFYGIWTKRDVQLGPDGVKVTDPNKANSSLNGKGTTFPLLAGPTKQQTNWKELYDEMERRNKEFKRSLKEYKDKSVLISRLPTELQGSSDEVVAKTSECTRKLMKYTQSVWFGCSVIEEELSQIRSINTNIISEDDHTKEVYRCVQLFLNAIEYYDGIIDGDQGRTKAALEGFQEAMDLTIDGKLGRQTWYAMLATLIKDIFRQVPT